MRSADQPGAEPLAVDRASGHQVSSVFLCTTICHLTSEPQHGPGATCSGSENRGLSQVRPSDDSAESHLRRPPVSGPVGPVNGDPSHQRARRRLRRQDGEPLPPHFGATLRADTKDARALQNARLAAGISLEYLAGTSGVDVERLRGADRPDAWRPDQRGMVGAGRGPRGTQPCLLRAQQIKKGMVKSLWEPGQILESARHLLLPRRRR